MCAAAVPPFKAPPGANSNQVDDAHQQHILELNRIISCFIGLLE